MNLKSSSCEVGLIDFLGGCEASASLTYEVLSEGGLHKDLVHQDALHTIAV